jgi:hypothetical protein
VNRRASQRRVARELALQPKIEGPFDTAADLVAAQSRVMTMMALRAAPTCRKIVHRVPHPHGPHSRSGRGHGHGHVAYRGRPTRFARARAENDVALDNVTSFPQVPSKSTG